MLIISASPRGWSGSRTKSGAQDCRSNRATTAIKLLIKGLDLKDFNFFRLREFFYLNYLFFQVIFVRMLKYKGLLIAFKGLPVILLLEIGVSEVLFLW